MKYSRYTWYEILETFDHKFQAVYKVKTKDKWYSKPVTTNKIIYDGDNQKAAQKAVDEHVRQVKGSAIRNRTFLDDRGCEDCSW